MFFFTLKTRKKNISELGNNFCFKWISGFEVVFWVFDGIGLTRFLWCFLGVLAQSRLKMGFWVKK